MNTLIIVSNAIFCSATALHIKSSHGIILVFQQNEWLRNGELLYRSEKKGLQFTLINEMFIIHSRNHYVCVFLCDWKNSRMATSTVGREWILINCISIIL